MKPDDTETRPLTPTERAALDVGNFFTMHPSTMRVLNAFVRREITEAQAVALLTPCPTLGRTMLDCAGVVAIGLVLAVLDLMLLPWGYAAAAYLGVAVTFLVAPVTLWRRWVRDWQRDRDAVAESLA